MHEQVIDLIDGNTFVTYRYVQSQLMCSPDEAKKLLFDAKAARPSLKATYVICGTTKATGAAVNGLSFKLVPEDILEEEKKMFASVTSEHVYSLQNSDSQSSALMQTSHHDLDQFSNLLVEVNVNSAADQKRLFHMMGPLKALGVDVKACGSVALARATASRQADIKAANDSRDALKKSLAASDKLKSASQTKIAAKFFAQPVKPLGSSTSSSSSSGSGSGSSSTSTTAPKSKPKPTSIFGAASSAAPSTSSASKETKLSEADAVGNSDDEWEDGGVVDKTKLKSRKRVANEPSGSGGVGEADVLKSMGEGEQGGDGYGGLLVDDDNSNPGAFRVHGAMDDFFEDQQEKERDRLDRGGAAAKKMKKIKVEKVSMDEKGYMVTEFVDEYVTDEDVPVVAKQTAKQSAPLSKPVPKAASAKAGAGGKAAPTGMKSMMSFVGGEKK
jgi:hypothetical protein